MRHKWTELSIPLENSNIYSISLCECGCVRITIKNHLKFYSKYIIGGKVKSRSPICMRGELDEDQLKIDFTEETKPKIDKIASIALTSNNGVTTAVVLAKEWFKGIKIPYIQEKDFVVCRWYTFSDGFNIHIEGKQTIAICKERKDAIKIFKFHEEELEEENMKINKLKEHLENTPIEQL